MKPFFVFVGILFLLFPSSSIGNPYPSQVKSYEGVLKYLPRHAREMLSSTVLFQTQTKTFQQANRSGTALLAPPANDNYSNREFIGGDSGTVSADNTEATIETGEPHHIPFPYAQNSIWYTWTAPYNGQFGFDTENSTFSTLLAA